jgi:hypothetical protein
MKRLYLEKLLKLTAIVLLLAGLFACEKENVY